VRIRCVGDSITFGQHLDLTALAWPARMGAEGRGICGETTRQALERFPRDVQTDPADVTVLQWGHNDANRWGTDAGLPRVSFDAYRANLVEMIQRCRAFDTPPVLCTLTPTRKTRQYDTDVHYYNTEVRRVAHAQKVPLVDVRQAFLDGNLDELLMDDGIHLTEVGHDLYADTVSSVVLSKVLA
jgi:lysophospholipase L1-like esterase